MQMPKAAWPLGDEVFQNGEQPLVNLNLIMYTLPSIYTTFVVTENPTYF